MGLPAPRLDDKTFAQLMEDVRKLIPRYAPEWTDFNTSDPGITFLELFALLTEQQRYYLDQVDDKSILKFLKLLGVEPKPTIAARTDVTFSRENLFKSILVPQGTQLLAPLSTAPGEAEQPLIFETEAPLWVVPATLDKIISVSSVGVKDNTAINQINGLSFAAFEEEVGGSDRVLYLGLGLTFLTLEDVFGSQNDRLIAVLSQYFGMSWVEDSNRTAIQKTDTTVTITDVPGDRRLTFYRADVNASVTLTWDANLADSASDWGMELVVVEESAQNHPLLPKQGMPFPAAQEIALTVNLLETTPVRSNQRNFDPHRDEIPRVIPSVQLIWEYLYFLGEEPEWLPLEIIRDETNQLTRSGRVWFKSPNQMTASTIFSSFSQPLYWIQVRLAAGEYENPPQIDFLRLNTIAAVQHQTFCQTATFSSNGQLTQTFPVSYLALISPASSSTVQMLDRHDNWQDVDSVTLTPDPAKGQLTIAFPATNLPLAGQNNLRLISYAANFRSQSEGQSNGLPYQRFQFMQLPVVAEQVALQVQRWVKLGDRIVDEIEIPCLLKIQRIFPSVIQSNVPLNVPLTITLIVTPQQNLTRVEIKERLDSGLSFEQIETGQLISNNPSTARFIWDHLQAGEPVKITYSIRVHNDGQTIAGDISIYDSLHCPPMQGSLPVSKLVLREKPQALYWQDWTQVKDFDASKPTDRHYVIDAATGQLQFGDGIHGAIPAVPANDSTNDLESYSASRPTNSTNTIRNIRLCSYQTCQGRQGNIASYQISDFQINRIDDAEMIGLKNLLEGLKVTNHLAAIGGSDPETLEFAQLRARKQLKVSTRAVTSEDFEFLALATPGIQVARAKAFPFVPEGSKTDRRVAPWVTIVVVPNSPDSIARPTPSPGFLQTVCFHLDRHRLITTRIEVIPPNYVGIGVSTTVRLKRGFSEAVTRDEIDRALQRFLHPLRGGSQGQGWEFGRTVYLSEIYQQIEGVPAVDCVQRAGLSFQGVEASRDKDGNIVISPQSLVYSLEHQIEIVNPEAACRTGEGWR